MPSLKPTTSNLTHFGKYCWTGAGYYTENMDEFRFSKGIARWTADFSGNLPAAEYAMDSYTKLLLHFDFGAYLTEACGNSYAGTSGMKAVTGTTKVSGASLLFNSSYVEIPDSDDWYFPGDFTIDFWGYFTAAQNMMFHRQVAGAGFWQFYWETSNNIEFFARDSGGNNVTVFHAPWIPTLSAWHHIALVRSGNTWYVFIDGVPLVLSLDSGSYSAAQPNIAAPLRIGAIDASTYPVAGNIEQYRISNGIARWTADFSGSLPTSVYTVDSYTKLLFQTKMGGYLDSVGANHLTNWGLAQTAVGKDGNAALLDRHNEDSLFVSAGAPLSPVDKMTIACWVWFEDVAGDQYLWREDSAFLVEKYTSTDLLYSIYQSDGTHKYVFCASPFVAHQWHHVAQVADGAYVRFYVDGVSQGVPISYDGTIGSPAGTITFGSNNAFNNRFNGRMCELLFLKGDFLSPTEVVTLAGGKYYRCT